MSDDDFSARKLLQSTEEWRLVRDRLYANQAGRKLHNWLEATVLKPGDRSSLPMANEHPLTMAQFLGLAIEFGSVDALDFVFRAWKAGGGTSSEPKEQDWPTILRRFEFTKQAIEEVLPLIRTLRDWQRHAELPICMRLEKAKLKSLMLNRQRRAPAKIASELVAFEYMTNEHVWNGARVSASSIRQRYKDRVNIVGSSNLTPPRLTD